MKEQIIKLVYELIRDVKSRKFLLAVAYGLLVVVNVYTRMGVTFEELVLILVPVVAFVVIEGIADIGDRERR